MIVVTSSSSPLLAQVYKVLFGYAPQKEDELELSDGDYVCVSTSDQGQTGEGVWGVMCGSVRCGECEE